MTESAIRNIQTSFDNLVGDVAGVPIQRHAVVSLFSGCGGMDLGFLGGFPFGRKYYDRLPFEIVWSNDIDPDACKTYQHNLGHEIVCDDIAGVNIERLPKADVVLGGFPCQDFSVAGKRRGFSSPRGRLYQFMVDAVRHCEPELFLAENVRGLLSMPGAMDEIRTDFSDVGYSVQYKVLNARNYRVPQNRERVIIIGTKPSIEFEWPDNEIGEVSAQEAIGDLEDIALNGMNGHAWSNAKRITGQGQDPIKADQPSVTIRAEHHGHIEYHYRLGRRLSARECARLQSFPDQFQFVSSTSQSYRQIGNAVPPVMAWHIAKSVSEALP